VTVTPERSSYGDDFAMRLLDVPRPARAPRAPLPPTPPAAPRAVMPAMPFALSTFSGRRLGISIETLDEQLAQYFGVKDGVLVKSVTADSAAAKAGLKAGDVITSVNGRQIYETSDVNRAIDRTESDEFTIEITRDKKPQTIKGKVESRRRSSAFFDEGLR
jgi:C-terminal processing protease CtpA/Prc